MVFSFCKVEGSSFCASRVVQLVKNTPARAGDTEKWVWARVRKIPWRRKCQPTLVHLPGKSHGQRSVAGYNPWGLRAWHDRAHVHYALCLVLNNNLRICLSLLIVLCKSFCLYVSNRVMAVPATVIYFTCYDQLTALLRSKLGENESRIPIVAGIVARRK